MALSQSFVSEWARHFAIRHLVFFVTLNETYIESKMALVSSSCNRY